MERLVSGTATSTNWRAVVPVLAGASVVLRELRLSDAPALFAMLTTEDVARFVSPPPTTIEGFEQFIDWSLGQRKAGSHASFAVTLVGSDTAIGIFQLRELEPGFTTAQWGYAIGSPYWGTGVFLESAEMMAEFAFRGVGVHRLETLAAVRNPYGNGAPRKIGAQTPWAILDEDWYTRVAWQTMIVH
jgi:[ribosomal protein S5]-alanine N-acetyltransferase